MKTKLALLLLLTSLLTAAIWQPRIPDIIRLPTPSRVELKCVDGQIPTVWVHMNAAVVKCE